MATSMSNRPARPGTIVLKGKLNRNQVEGWVQATKTIIPGMLIEKTTTEDPPYGYYQPHATQGGDAECLVAIEPMLADVPFQTFKGGTVDDEYVAGDHVRAHIAQPGEEFHMFLKASGTVTALSGASSLLMSAGNGDLEVRTTTLRALFKALEVVTPGGTRTRIRVRRL